ncbi:hypothetical protein WA1_18860 [Scytonema hofmannii PCC 7110]|uniref:Uncharacterized protein n=1 Tax=Scytonema hofmannii PCC 7110 TaxID=128403 RepID=A0A139XBJ0_9CYAN|nr:hypothetical protein [Scytonema hofmannii]KYC42064.1 hypothetical protein WA1_18860 [Scytonema hofmannii PCC 7110]
MNIGELRSLFKEYLKSKLRIDRWGLGLPDSIQKSQEPPSIGLDKPALDIEITPGEGWGESRVSIVTTTIPFQVIYRFDSCYEYERLPRGEAEALLTQILTQLQTPSCLSPDIQQIEPSGSVSIAEHKNSDQLIIFEIDIKVTFESETNRKTSKFFSPCQPN